MTLPPHVARGDTALAGALAGLVAECLLHPLDTLAVRSKVHPQGTYGSLFGSASLILRQEGPRGLLAGLSGTVASSMPGSAAYFSSYEVLRARLIAATDGRHVHGVNFMSGALAEVLSSIITAPLEVAKGRLQLGVNPHRATGGLVPARTNFPSLRAALAGVYRERGVLRGLYAGWVPTLGLDMLFSGVQFSVFEAVKLALRGSAGSLPPGPSPPTVGSGPGASPGSLAAPGGAASLSVSHTLLAGCAAGAVAAVVCNPLDVITVRIVIQSGGTAFGGSARQVLRTAIAEGPVALWRGTLPRVAQNGTSAAIFFSVYEYARAALGTPPEVDSEGWGGGE